MLCEYDCSAMTSNRPGNPDEEKQIMQIKKNNVIQLTVLSKTPFFDKTVGQRFMGEDVFQIEPGGLKPFP